MGKQKLGVNRINSIIVDSYRAGFNAGLIVNQSKEDAKLELEIKRSISTLLKNKLKR